VGLERRATNETYEPAASTIMVLVRQWRGNFSSHQSPQLDGRLPGSSWGRGLKSASRDEYLLIHTGHKQGRMVCLSGLTRFARHQHRRTGHGFTQW